MPRLGPSDVRREDVLLYYRRSIVRKRQLASAISVNTNSPESERRVASCLHLDLTTTSEQKYIDWP
jgi:hypothetical protein